MKSQATSTLLDENLTPEFKRKKFIHTLQDGWGEREHRESWMTGPCELSKAYSGTLSRRNLRRLWAI